MPVDPNNLDAVLDAIKREYGDSAIHAGANQPPIGRILTGAAELDYATNGGFPIGRWSHLYGGYMSCKSLTCWCAIARAQKMGMDCAYYNIEKQYDEKWAKARGIDVKRLLVVEGSTIEGVGAKLESLVGVVHFHAIDSLAAAVSVDALRAKMEDWHMGLQARAWGKVIAKVNDRFDENQNTILMVNQVRDVFGRGGGEAPPGGKSIDFISSLSMHFRRSSWLFRDARGILDPDASSAPTMSGDPEPNGMEFQVRVVKSRVGPPFRTARLRLDFASGEYDELWALAKAAGHYGVVDQPSKGRYVLQDGTKLHGLKKLREAIDGDKGLQQAIRQAMLNGA